MEEGTFLNFLRRQGQQPVDLQDKLRHVAVPSYRVAVYRVAGGLYLELLALILAEGEKKTVSVRTLPVSVSVPLYQLAHFLQELP